jgi:hypothetical protein
MRADLRFIVAAAAAIACTPAAASAQAATCGWHFLDDVDEPPALVALRARVTGSTPELDDAFARMRRWYRDCDATAARVAAQTLRRISSRRGLADADVVNALHGIALVRGPEVHVTHGTGLFAKPARFQSNSERDGVRLLVRVFNTTKWPELATELAETAFTTRKPETLRAAADALRSIAAEANDAGAYALLAEIELLQQQYAAAAADAKRADDGGDARGARARGMALLLAGDDMAAGGDAYMRGLRGATGSLLHRYFDDIRGLLGDDEMDAWEELEPAARAEWIRARWEWRALMAGVTVQERLAEHHRRLEYAMKAYTRTSYRGAPGRTAVWTSVSRADMPLDDRGVIYLRHGAPDREIRMVGGQAQRIAWGYGAGDGGSRVFEFDRTYDVPDFFLAGPVAVCRDTAVDMHPDHPSAARVSPLPRVGSIQDWSASIHAFDPRLGMFYQRCGVLPPSELPAYYATARRDVMQQAQEAWQTETALPRYENTLATSLNLYAFRAGFETELVGYLSVGARDLRAATTPAGSEYALRVLLGAGNPVAGDVVRADTTFAFTTPQPLPADARIGAAIPLRVRGSAGTRVTATVSNRHNAGQGRVMSTVRDVPVFGAGLAMSDIVIGEDRDGAWRRGPHRLAPLPGHVVSSNALFRVHHELYGALAGDPLQVTLTVAPGTDATVLGALRSLIARREALTLVFREQAEPGTDGTAVLVRTVTANLEPGAYVLIIEVRNERTNESAESRTTLVVVR